MLLKKKKEDNPIIKKLTTGTVIWMCSQKKKHLYVPKTAWKKIHGKVQLWLCCRPYNYNTATWPKPDVTVIYQKGLGNVKAGVLQITTWLFSCDMRIWLFRTGFDIFYICTAHAKNFAEFVFYRICCFHNSELILKTK